MRIETRPPQFIRWQSALLFCLLLVPASASSQTRQPVATKFRLEQIGDGTLAKRLYVTVDARERKVTNQAFQAWIIDDGKSVAYSGLDGSGGFENEGQSLRIYDVRTGKARKVMSEYVGIIALMQVKVSTGQLALLIRMGDGGLGASYFAVVDPRRGEVFYRSWAELVELKGDRIRLAFYNEEDWDAILGERAGEPEDPSQVIPKTKVKPKKFENHDLKRVLKMRVIYNKREN